MIMVVELVSEMIGIEILDAGQKQRGSISGCDTLGVKQVGGEWTEAGWVTSH